MPEIALPELATALSQPIPPLESSAESEFPVESPPPALPGAEWSKSSPPPSEPDSPKPPPLPPMPQTPLCRGLLEAAASSAPSEELPFEPEPPCRLRRRLIHCPPESRNRYRRCAMSWLALRDSGVCSRLPFCWRWVRQFSVIGEVRPQIRLRWCPHRRMWRIPAARLRTPCGLKRNCAPDSNRCWRDWPNGAANVGCRPAPMRRRPQARNAKAA